MIGDESHAGNGVNLIFHLLWPSGFGQDLPRAHILSQGRHRSESPGGNPLKQLVLRSRKQYLFFQQIQSRGYKESQLSAFFFSSFSADRKEITSSHLHMESIFPREKQHTSFKKCCSVNTAAVHKEELSDNSSWNWRLTKISVSRPEWNWAGNACHITLPLKVLQQLVLSSQHWSLLHPGGVRAPSMAHNKGRTERFLSTVLFPWELHALHSVHPQGCWSQHNLPILPFGCSSRCLQYHSS